MQDTEIRKGIWTPEVSFQRCFLWHRAFEIRFSLKPRSRAIGARQEDSRLLLLVEEVGTNWIAVAEKIPGRTRKSCRLRWDMPASACAVCVVCALYPFAAAVRSN